MKEDVWKECIFDFREIPTKCDVCGSDKVRYTSNAEIYHGKQYGNGYCYLCDNCGASVGVHNTKSKKPLGRLATKEMKRLKMQCHYKFDPLWKTYNFKRTDCYGYLAHKLGLHLRETHFGWFDIEYLNKSLEILNDIDFNDIWKYIKERTDKMELWIRHQNKTILQKVDNLLISDGNNAERSFSIYTNSLRVQNILGRYKTKERALEVLDEIQEAELGNFHYKCSSNVKVSNNEDTIVYQMPAE